MKSSLVRVPIRLGEESFTQGVISERNVERMLDTMKAFKLIMKVNGVERYMACATSAMREASNGQELTELISMETGLDVQIIDGKREAEIIAFTDLHELIENDKTYLYVDVGGGSTEFTIFANGGIVTSKSFKIGTVRLINNMVRESIWEEMERWIEENTRGYKNISLIGSGGNINKLFKISGRKEGKPLSYIYLNAQFQFLKNMTYEERISELGLNPDRADVIIPATRIYLVAFKSSGAQKIFVPKIGLSDGIVRTLYCQDSEKEKDSLAVQP